MSVTALVILIFSLIPNPLPSDLKLAFSDKLGHFLAYTALSFLAFLSFYNGKVLRTFSLVVLFSFAYGGLAELLQFLTPRHPDLLDLAADLLGSLIGAAAGLIIMRLRNPDGSI